MLFRSQVALVPEQAPFQPANVEPELATAVSVTDVPAEYEPLHELPHEMPLGEDDTVPLPLMATLSKTLSMVPVLEPNGAAVEPPPQALTSMASAAPSMAVCKPRAAGRTNGAALRGITRVFMEVPPFDRGADRELCRAIIARPRAVIRPNLEVRQQMRWRKHTGPPS